MPGHFFTKIKHIQSISWQEHGHDKDHDLQNTRSEPNPNGLKCIPPQKSFK